MQVRCHRCDKVAKHFYLRPSGAFRNVNERKKHCRNEGHTSIDLKVKRHYGYLTHAYQVLRQLEKQQRPLKHGETR